MKASISSIARRARFASRTKLAIAAVATATLFSAPMTYAGITALNPNLLSASYLNFNDNVTDTSDTDYFLTSGSAEIYYLNEIPYSVAGASGWATVAPDGSSLTASIGSGAHTIGGDPYMDLFGQTWSSGATANFNFQSDAPLAFELNVSMHLTHYIMDEPAIHAANILNSTVNTLGFGIGTLPNVAGIFSGDDVADFHPTFRIVGTANSPAYHVDSISMLSFAPSDHLGYGHVNTGSTVNISAQVLGSSPFEVADNGGNYGAISVADGTTVAITRPDTNYTCGLRTKAVAIGSTGTLDIGEGPVVIDYTGTSPLGDVNTAGSIAYQVKTGYNAGAWNGYGIISSVAAAAASGSDKLGVAYAEASALGITEIGTCDVDGSSVILAVTYYGDANIDGDVDFDDLLIFANNYNAAGTFSWKDADFDYDGDVDFDDQLRLAANYNKNSQTPLSAAPDMAAFEADWALAQSLVPEPTTFCALGSAGLALLRRRR